MSISLVLLPGLLCDEALWRPQIDAFSGQVDCRVPDLTQADSMADLARSVLAWAPPRFALAGLSMGGYVALEIMRQAPNRVELLALLDTSGRPDSSEQTDRRHALLELSRQGSFKGVTPRLLPQLIHPDRLQDRALTSVVMGMAERVGQEAFVRQQTAIIQRSDSLPSLGRISCPTLVLCGRQDVLTPLDRAQELAEGIAGARLRVIEDCGHLSTLERPDAVNQALRDWLGPAMGTQFG
jgi:pimeloyl-ACP methyl ester carboxylesterase